MNVYHCVSAERIQRFLQPVTSDLIEGVVDERAAGMKISQADRDFISGFFAHALDDYPRGRYGPEAVRFRCCLSWHRCRGAPLCAEPFLFWRVSRLQVRRSATATFYVSRRHDPCATFYASHRRSLSFLLPFHRIVFAESLK